jgi:hypothetical protein
MNKLYIDFTEFSLNNSIVLSNSYDSILLSDLIFSPAFLKSYSNLLFDYIYINDCFIFKIIF